MTRTSRRKRWDTVTADQPQHGGDQRPIVGMAPELVNRVARYLEAGPDLAGAGVLPEGCDPALGTYLVGTFSPTPPGLRSSVHSRLTGNPPTDPTNPTDRTDPRQVPRSRPVQVQVQVQPVDRSGSTPRRAGLSILTSPETPKRPSAPCRPPDNDKSPPKPFRPAKHIAAKPLSEALTFRRPTIPGITGPEPRHITDP